MPYLVGTVRGMPAGIPLRYPGYPCTPGTPPARTVPPACTAGTAPPPAAVQKTASPARGSEKQSPSRDGSSGPQERTTLLDAVTPSGCPWPDIQTANQGGPPWLARGSPARDGAPGLTSQQSGPSAAPPPRIWGSGAIQDRGFHGGGVMNLQSPTRVGSSRFLEKPANTYCCAHWI